MNPPKGPPVSLPYVDPNAQPTDPRAAAYLNEMRNRGVGLPKYNEQRGGEPTSIPRLDLPHAEGQPMTMAQQAELQRRAMGNYQPPAPAPSIIDRPQPQQTNEAQVYLQQADLLPPEAQVDPAFRPGHGAMFAVNQPDLARKYGVVRGHQRIPPQMLMQPPGSTAGPPRRRAIEATATDLQKALEARTTASALSDAVERAEESEAVAAAKAGGAGTVAERLGGGTEAAARASTQQEIKERLAEMDAFDLDGIRQQMVRDLLNNEEQRKIVEARVKPLDLGDLIMSGTVSQIVPIVPGTFEPEFQSLGGDVDLALKRLIVEEGQRLTVDDRYLLDKYALMGLACSLKALNRNPLPDFRDEKTGAFDEEKFLKKFNLVVRYPLPMLASLGVHYFWFDVRVRKLFVATNLKNG